MSLKEQIDLARLPQHIAVIMDGNGRWAKAHGKNRIFGHSNGVKAVRETAEACAELGVKHLTMYAFSTENWNRPQMEVGALMELLFNTTKKELETLMKNDIRLRMIGDIDALPRSTAKEIRDTMEKTAGNKRMDLILALSYSGRQEITRAAKSIAMDVQAGKLSLHDVTENTFSSYLYTTGIPDPELLIRTSGEQRLSNFLLWQLAYAEYYFTEIFWPEFSREKLYEALLWYQNRERRFGQTSEQLTAKK